MTGFILAAGLGTRLRPITDHVPKALVPVAGVPLLGRCLSRMHRAGISRIGVNAHHRAETLSAFKASSTIGFSLFHEEGAVRGTGGAFWFAREFLSSDEAFCVSNVDIVALLDYASLADRFMRSNVDCALIAARATRRGTLYFDPHTLDYAGVPAAGPSMPDAHSADFVGTAFYRRRFMEVIREDDFSIVPVWKRAQESGLSVKVFVDDSLYWKDLGTPQSLASIHFDVVSGTVALELPDWMVIDANRRCAYNAALPEARRAGIGPLAWIEPPALDASSVFERSVVLNGAAIGPGRRYESMLLTPWGDIDLGTT